MVRGAAVVDGDMAYFMNWNGEVCSYNVSSKKLSGANFQIVPTRVVV